jgi:hypothetical protein
MKFSGVEKQHGTLENYGGICQFVMSFKVKNFERPHWHFVESFKIQIQSFLKCLT